MFLLLLAVLPVWRREGGSIAIFGPMKMIQILCALKEDKYHLFTPALGKSRLGKLRRTSTHLVGQ